MEFEKRMNKDKVEFIFEPKFSPLKRKTLSKEIKIVTKVKSVSKQLEPESKLEILNYLINSLSCTTNAITKYFGNPQKNINNLLKDFKSNCSDNSMLNQVIDYKYNGIPANTKNEAFYLIQENSTIRKDNYSIMIDAIKLTLDELINPQLESQFRSKSFREPILNPTIKIHKNNTKSLSKTFNFSVNLNNTSNITKDTFVKNNLQQFHLNQINPFISHVSKNQINGIDFSYELKDKEQNDIKDLMFKKKMINKKQKGKRKLTIQRQNSPKKINNTSILLYKSNNSQMNNIESPQKNRSAIINWKNNNIPLPIPLGSLYQNSTNGLKNKNRKNYSNSIDNGIKKDNSKLMYKHKSNYRLQKIHDTSISSLDKKKQI